MRQFVCSPPPKPNLRRGPIRIGTSRTNDKGESGRTLRLTLPADLAVVRGILIVGPGAGGDSRDYYQQVWYREFMHLHDFAFLGAQGFSSHAANFKVMQNALKQLAVESKHPELVSAPYAATGFSAGGGYVILGTDGNGNIRPSNPVLVVVRKRPAT